MTDSSTDDSAAPAAPPSGAGPLNFRVLESGDESGVATLWATETPWGAPQPELVAWYHANPCAGSFIVVAVDAVGEVVGQIVMMATRVSVAGREVPAIHVFAPIVSRAARESVRVTGPSDHPIAQMFAYAMAEARRRQFALIYSMPAAKWLGFFHRLPQLSYAQLPLWSLPLPLAGPLPLENGYVVSRLVTYDERVDTLWSAASCLAGCRTIRDAGMLQWRVGGPLYDVTAVERNGELVGLVAAKEKDGQWTICDLLARDTGPSLRMTLAAACNLGHVQSLLPNRKNPLRKVALLTTAALAPAAAELGFARDAYDYLLLVRALDPSIAKEDVAPDLWYVSDNE